mgnify:CR=1 FL=1
MENIKRFELAINVLSKRLSDIFLSMDIKDKERIREIRLRTNKPVVVITDKGTEFLLSPNRLTQVYSELILKTDETEINEIFRRLCGYSVHSFTDAINRGYITVSGGHRAGVAGTAVSENGEITAVRDINSVNLRIAREIKGAADEIYKLYFMHSVTSLIIACPPASGKTTILRDLARQISGEERGRFLKTFICDERGEIGACFSGEIQNDIGINCDLITSYPKAQGIMIGLRSFSPDIICCDEIATDEESRAVEAGVNSGVSFILTIHARSEEELRTKPLIKRLLLSGEFDNVVLLSGIEVGKIEKLFRAGDLID